MAQLLNHRGEVLRDESKSTQGQPQTSRVARVNRTLSSVMMNPDQAVTISTVWACLRYLSQNVGMLPWHVMQKTDDGGKTVETHPVDYIIHKRASLEWSAFQFRETMTHWALRWGNGYAEIEYDLAQRPVALHPIHPERVRVCRDPETKVLFYEVDNALEFRANEIFHIRGFGEAPVGVNVVAYAAESLGWAKASQLFGAAFFGNGLNPTAVIKLKEQAGIEELKERRKELDSAFRGVRNSSKYILLDEGDEYEAISISPEQAQFLNTNMFLVEEICRWFGVPPHKVMHLLRGTFSNIEHQSIEVVVDSIGPWTKRFEDEADFKLFGQNRPNFYTKVNLKGLMRGDTAARGTWYKMMREAGVYSANDILRLEDENLIGPEGDKRILQSQYTTLERIGEDPLPTPNPSPPSKSSAKANADDEDEVPMDERVAMQQLLEMEAAWTP